MLTRRSIQIVLTLLCVTFIASCGGNADKDVPLIFAAASLADVLVESAEIYEKETGKGLNLTLVVRLLLRTRLRNWMHRLMECFL